MGTDIRSKIRQYFGICEFVFKYASKNVSDVTYILRAETSDGKTVIVDMKHFRIDGRQYKSTLPSGYHFHIAVLEYYNGKWELVDLSLVAGIQRPKPVK